MFSIQNNRETFYNNYTSSYIERRTTTVTADRWKWNSGGELSVRPSQLGAGNTTGLTTLVVVTDKEGLVITAVLMDYNTLCFNICVLYSPSTATTANPIQTGLMCFAMLCVHILQF